MVLISGHCDVVSAFHFELMDFADVMGYLQGVKMELAIEFFVLNLILPDLAIFRMLINYRNEDRC